ncbi:hypothetical protein D3C86_1915830 [compost metagenome]
MRVDRGIGDLDCDLLGARHEMVADALPAHHAEAAGELCRGNRGFDGRAGAFRMGDGADEVAHPARETQLEIVDHRRLIEATGHFALPAQAVLFCRPVR